MDDDRFEQDLKEILKDTPSLNDYSSTVQGGMIRNDPVTPKPQAMIRPDSQNRPISGTVLPQQIPPATSNISLSSPEKMTPSIQNQTGPSSGLIISSQSKIDNIRAWSINTYKCTRQMISERLGKGTKTVDVELESQIEILRDTQRKYLNILRLARALTSHFYHVVQTQRQLGDSFADLSQKSPELQEEFSYNAETQRTLCKNGEALLNALNFFTSSVNTLVNKTMEDTLTTVKAYETARIEYDAYRTDLDYLKLAPKDASINGYLDAASCKFDEHKNKYERLKADVSIKLKFLDENRIKVLHKNLLLFHNAIASYFSGNQESLESTLRQFNISLKSPNSSMPSWLEQ